jgi:hypothetical protein
MRLFHRDQPAEGEVVRTRATIERVTLETAGDDDEKTVEHNLRVFLTFAVDDDLFMQERFVLSSGALPLPGSAVDVAYGEGRIDFNPRSVTPPDPAVPRGWGAGIWEVPRLSGERSRGLLSLFEFGQERDVFRAGRRHVAAVLEVEPLKQQRRGARLYRLTLSNPGREALEPKVWLPTAYVPSVEDTIQVAVSNEGTVALDCDERFEGAPLRAPVFNAPVPEEPLPEPVPNMLDLQLAGLQEARKVNPKGYEASVRALLEQALATERITQAEFDHRLGEALS